MLNSTTGPENTIDTKLTTLTRDLITVTDIIKQKEKLLQMPDAKICQ